jgi:hypothetical protein
MKNKLSIKVGGWTVIIAAILFTGVFAFLAIQFNYPDVLEGTAKTVLPSLIAMGNTGRFVWSLYALLPLAWIPVGVGAFQALKQESEGSIRIGMHLMIVSSVSMMLGLMRWPSIHWQLGVAFEQATTSQQEVISVIFQGLNVYLGNYVGEFLGEMCANTFFIIVGYAMVKSPRFPRWMGYLGIAVGGLQFVAMFRNVFSIANTVQDMINLLFLFPLWLIVLGIGLIRSCRHT